ncbi:hypothetical protein MKZ38_001815 [Zalerion maritima]|uniref:DNA replication factor Cdt1 C-terminal domain-containing protein n=1 Tax=Zalerion maritima TaxID=339359 RepID=A0AAD5WRP5_9PEZI|nr:hypothetical protein MKZ38_001815 [Zalerion maritima]
MPAGVTKRGRGRPRKTEASSTINSFAKVSKASKLTTKKEAALNAAVSAGTEIKTTPVNNARVATALTPSLVARQTPTPQTKTRKRKAHAAPAVVSDTEDDVTPTVSPSKKKTCSPATKRARHFNGSPQQQKAAAATTATPRKTSRNQTQSELSGFVRASSTDSDLCVANNTLSRLRLGASFGTTRPKPLSPSLSSGSSSYATPATSDSEEPLEREHDLGDSAPPFPQDLQDVCNLFASFLKTLALHATYNGGGSVECKNLLPDVSRAWGRRAVSVADVRLILGILEYGKGNQQKQHKNLLKLADYGRNKHHIEISPDVYPLNEQAMRTIFDQTLQNLWRREHGNYLDSTAFLTALPTANITKKPVSRLTSGLGSLNKRKGQQTLQAFNESVAKKKGEALRVQAAAAEAAAKAKAEEDAQKSNKQPGGKLSVLDRVRAKESLLAQLATEPGRSPEACARRRTLQRCPEVAAVVGMMCTSSDMMGGAMARVSFPMATVSEKLKDSLGIGLSVEEGREAIRMLGVEVAPEWLKVLRVGGREHVVMMRGFTPGKGEVERRVKGRLAA